MEFLGLHSNCSFKWWIHFFPVLGISLCYCSIPDCHFWAASVWFYGLHVALHRRQLPPRHLRHPRDVRRTTTSFLLRFPGTRPIPMNKRHADRKICAHVEVGHRVFLDLCAYLSKCVLQNTDALVSSIRFHCVEFLACASVVKIMSCCLKMSLFLLSTYSGRHLEPVVDRMECLCHLFILGRRCAQQGEKKRALAPSLLLFF